MIRHLTPAYYVTMPWANGRGRTVQMLRLDGPDGGLLLRLSMASVVEDGPFSIFPGVERNLTVISGPGFDLVGDVALRAGPLVPVAFAGDLAIAAAGVVAACEDFNVMTARHLPLPDVQVVTENFVTPPEGGTMCLFAVGAAQVNGLSLRRHDLWITDEKTRLMGGPLIVVRVGGLKFFGEKF
jgi:uncharacterized protein